MYSSLYRLSSSVIHRLTRCQGELIASRSFSVSRMPPGQENVQHGVNSDQLENFRHGINSGPRENFQHGINSGPRENFQSGINSGPRQNFQQGINSSENFARNTRSKNFVRGILEDDGKDYIGGSRFPQYNVEQNADVVHIKLMRNNTFVTVTDSKGNKKLGASAGSLPEMKGGPKLSKYAAEATAEHVGRMSRNFGLKSVVMKVKGFTYFKKKRQAIMSWKEGFTSSKVGRSPIVYIEDTTRKPHNGCRLPKQRRV